MANDYDTTAKNVMLDQLGLNALRVSLHTADPGGANQGLNEVAGGTPPYARKVVAWNAAAGGAITATLPVTFDVPAGTTVAWVAYWNIAGTVRYLKKAVTNEVFALQGTYTLSSEQLDVNDP